MTKEEIIMAALLPQAKRAGLESAMTQEEECRGVVSAAKARMLATREEQELQVTHLEDSRLKVTFHNECVRMRLSMKKFKELFPQDYERIYKDCSEPRPCRATARIVLKKQQ